jgi:DNA end-binding protein Ku
MPRAIWKGSIAFGLVQIPVSLMPAEEAKELSFTLLDRRDLSPVGFERVNKRTGRKVEWKNVVKGYEYKKGRHVVVDERDFERANVEATHTIDIEQIVDPSSIDPRYYERPYYLTPDKAGAKAYVLLRETLKRAGMAAVGRVVIRTRQHLVLIEPQDELLLLLLLRFDHELRKPAKLELPKGGGKKLGVTPKERQMAETLVESLVGEWHPERFKDTYRDDLLKLIKNKVKRGEREEPEEEAKAAPERRAEVIDLAELLKQSLTSSRRSAGQKKRPRKRKAAA